MKIVVIGGNGLIGSKLVTRLAARGHHTVAASPETGLLADALAHASVVVDVSDAPTFDDPALLECFDTSTRNLLAAEAAAGVGHHVALSAVGAERLSQSAHFRARIAEERLVETSSIPYSIVRATQCFESMEDLAAAATDGDTVRLPPALIQPVAADDVAGALAAIALGPPLNGIVEVAGPDRFRLDELIRERLRAIGDPRRVVTDRHAGCLGGTPGEQALLPGDGAQIAATRLGPPPAI